VPVAFSSGDGRFAVRNEPLPQFAGWAGTSGVQVLTGDFNGDGKTDLALVRTGAPGWSSVPVALSTGDGRFAVHNRPLADFGTWAAASDVRVLTGDFDGDGRTDLALVRVGPAGWASVPVALSTGDGGFAVQNRPLADFAGWATMSGVQAVTGDFDGDRRTDIAMVRTGPSGWESVPVALSTGDGGFSVRNRPVPEFAGLATAAGVRVLAGDFDGDRRTDLALLRQEPGWASVPVALSAGDGTFAVQNRAVAAFADWAAAPGVRPVVGDFTGDGRADVALVRHQPGWSSIPVAASGQGGFTVQNAGVGPFAEWAAASGAYALVGDYDGDAKADVAVLRLAPTVASVAVTPRRRR
jgi:predicted alpha/beta hydrolase